MAEVVEAKRFEASCVSCALEPAAQRRGIESPTEAVREDVVVGPSELVAPTESIERCGGLIRKRNFAPSAALRGAQLGNFGVI
jgi:hypothetical protein